MGDRYELKDKCLFVDAFDRDSNNPGRKPDDIKAAHVMDVQKGQCLKLNDSAGFIARFIVQGVDVGLIPQILLSSFDYSNATTTPQADVQNVLAMLFPEFVKKRDSKSEHENPEPRGKISHNGKYALDFKVNWFGTGCCKF